MHVSMLYYSPFKLEVSKYWKLVFQFCFDKPDTDAVSTFQTCKMNIGQF